MKKRITQDDYVKANRKASREAEIEMYGHPICPDIATLYNKNGVTIMIG